MPSALACAVDSKVQNHQSDYSTSWDQFPLGGSKLGISCGHGSSDIASNSSHRSQITLCCPAPLAASLGLPHTLFQMPPTGTSETNHKSLCSSHQMAPCRAQMANVGLPSTPLKTKTPVSQFHLKPEKSCPTSSHQSSTKAPPATRSQHPHSIYLLWSLTSDSNRDKTEGHPLHR